MNLICKVVLSLLIAGCAITEAQTNVTADGTGAISNIPAYSGATSLTSSPLFAANGGVGINTSSPQALLDIVGNQGTVNLRLFDAYGQPEFNSISTISFAGADAPNGFVKIQGQGEEWSGGDGLMITWIAQNNTLFPALWLQYNGNFGIDNPGNGELSIITPNADSETGEHIVNTDPTGYSVLRLGTDNIAPQGFGLHQFGSLWPDDPAGATAPSSTSLLAFESGGMELDTTAAAPIRFFTSGSAAGNERMRITPSGNVGIGTTSPGSPLEVNGSIKLTNGSGGSLGFSDGTVQTTAWTGGSSFSSAFTGVQNTASSYLVMLTPNGGVPSYIGNVVNDQNVFSYNTYYNGVNNWMYGENSYSAAIRMGSGVGAMAFYTTPYGSTGTPNSTMDTTGPKMSLSLTGGLSLGNPYVMTDPGAGSLIVAGNVGIGTSSPGAALEINGNVKLTSGSGASVTFPDGTVQSTAYLGNVCVGGDYAESVDVSGNKLAYEPGDVMVIGSESTSDVTKSAEPYSTLVAGIYSTRPGVVGRRQTTDPKSSTTEIPMAMVGIVPTKVSAENGPIHRGDLLVTSSLRGYAMKGTDPSKMLGAVLGKSLGSLDLGTGIIEVLVTLQ